MKQKIINYYPGAKGDFIVNFLNNRVQFLENGNGQSNTATGGKELVYANTIPLDQLDLYADLLLKTNFDTPYIVSHFLKLMDSKSLDKLTEKYDLYHISIDSEWRKQTNIDAIFKMYIKPMHESLYDSNKLEKTTNIEYFNLDTLLKRNNMPINNFNRIKTVIEFIENNVYHDGNYPQIKDIKYKDLFVDTFTETEFLCNQINKEFNKDFFKSILVKSFVPKTITVFDHNFNVEELGYRYYI